VTAVRFLRRAARLAPWLLALALAILFGRTLLRPPPAASPAGPQSAGVCAAPAPGPAGRSETSTPLGLGVTVITPTDYRADLRYGLLVLFPPAGFAPSAAERFYDVTAAATAAGFVVALSAPLPLSAAAVRRQSEVAATVAARWCIDTRRVVFAGHSDGGALAQGVVLRGVAEGIQPAAIVSSGAGIRAEDLSRETCPAPLSVSILHSRGDEHFPDYGEGAARWWASCFSCEPLPAATGADTCRVASRCAPGARVEFCAGTESHATRPPRFAERLQAALGAASPVPEP
jgi:polyhydroxybutyrate depolymerase